MSREGELHEANLRIKRWAKAAENAGIVIGGAKPEVRTSLLWSLSTRWKVFERMTWSLDGTADGPKVDTDACVAAAPSWGEVLLKYSLWARDANRQAQFRDRHVRGESLQKPPPDPPEWAATRAAMAGVAVEVGERTREWVKRSVRAQMAHIGMDDPVKFERAWLDGRARGLIR